ncbi:hypothetical protein COCNU_scaffold002867G000090 [Cocos nucifera]|nr:hypothetical protein [Cocos nucifera]
MHYELKCKFLPKDYRQSKFHKLHNLRQCDITIKEYKMEFEQLFMTCDIKEIEEPTKVRYLEGLKTEIEQAMQLQPFWMLNDIMIGNTSRKAATRNTLVMGWLRFVQAGRKNYYMRSLDTAYPVPVCSEEIKVFQRLANDKFCERNHCIVITGRGYPDVPTRRFLHHIVEQLHLPVYCLVDSDPYGFDILTTYRFGSMLANVCSGVLMLILVPKIFPLELEIMLQKGVKFEIEALSVNSLSFLADWYIPNNQQLKRKEGAHQFILSAESSLRTKRRMSANPIMPSGMVA